MGNDEAAPEGLTISSAAGSAGFRRLLLAVTSLPSHFHTRQSVLTGNYHKTWGEILTSCKSLSRCAVYGNAYLAKLLDGLPTANDLGKNGSVVRSLATILWLIALRREGQAVSGWVFLKLGCLVMPPALLGALAVLALMPG